MIGSYGNRYSNLTLANCDFLLILGARLDSRQTGTRPDTFARAAKKVHVDIDPIELQAKVKVDIALQCHLKPFLQALNEQLAQAARPEISAWLSVINRYKQKYPTRLEPAEAGPIDPNLLMERLSAAQLGRGHHHPGCGDRTRCGAAQSFRLKKRQRMLISGGMGAMGFALPAAMGAAKAAPDSTVIAIAGDGGIQINIQDLDTIVQHRLADQDRRAQQQLPGHGAPSSRTCTSAAGSSPRSSVTVVPTCAGLPRPTASRP